MRNYSRSHLSDPALLHHATSHASQERGVTAELLADLAEIDARKLYLPAAYPSMHAWCVGELKLSEEAAFKRIHAARAARRFPVLFAAVAEGRLHLSAVVMLASHLSEGTVDELVEAATHKTKSQLERLLAERSAPAMPACVPVGSSATDGLDEQHAPGRVGPCDEHAPGRAPSSTSPIAQPSRRYPVMVEAETYEKLRYAQELLSHCIPSGDASKVLDRALDTLIPKLEKRRFAATSKPRPGSCRSKTRGRYVPAEVRRAVWNRDGGQCTFVSPSRRRCESRMFLEFDHVLEVARGGRATAEGIRLRCRAHNQYGAECTFGTAFMQAKRDAARRATAEARANADEHDVTPWLRQLGFRADEARRAAAHGEAMREATLEERVRAALVFLAPPHRRTGVAWGTGSVTAT